jgi:hypothetical protein
MEESTRGRSEVTYKLIDQTERFPVKVQQWVICKQDIAPERTCTRAFCVVPMWEDRSPADSKADAEAIMQALIAAIDASTAISQAMSLVELLGGHPLLTNAVVLLEQAKAQIAEFKRTQELCLLCGHRRDSHDADNITGNCNAGLFVGFSNQCQCAGFILVK